MGVGCALLPQCFTFQSIYGASLRSLILFEMEKVVVSQLGKGLEKLADFGVFNRVVVRNGIDFESIEPAQEPPGAPRRCQITLYVRDSKSPDDDHTLTAVGVDGSKGSRKRAKVLSAPPLVISSRNSVTLNPWLKVVSPVLNSLFDNLTSWLLNSLRHLYRVFSINIMFFAGGDDTSYIQRQAFHTDYEPHKIFEHFDNMLYLRPLLAVISFSDVYKMYVFSKIQLADSSTGCDYLGNLEMSFGKHVALECPFGSIVLFQSNCMHAGMERPANCPDARIFRLHLYLEPVRSNVSIALESTRKKKEKVSLTTFIIEKM